MRILCDGGQSSIVLNPCKIRFFSGALHLKKNLQKNFLYQRPASKALKKILIVAHLMREFCTALARI